MSLMFFMFLFFLAKLITWHLFSAECNQDTDCIGVDSLCEFHKCLCDITYYGYNDHPYRCDPANNSSDPLVFLYVFVGGLCLWSLCMWGYKEAENS